MSDDNRVSKVNRRDDTQILNDIDEKLKSPDLSDEEKTNLLMVKKRLLAKQKGKNQVKTEEEMAKLKELQRIKDNAKTANAGRRSLIKQFTYNGLGERVNKMVHSSTTTTYVNRLVHWLTKGWGKQNTPLAPIPANTFHYTMNKIYTSDAARLPLAVVAWGGQLPLGWLDEIRGDLLELQNRTNTAHDKMFTIQLNHIMNCEPSDLAFTGNKRLEQDYERVAKRNFDEDDTALLSYLWLQGMETENRDSLWNVREFLELTVSGGRSGETAEILHEAYDVLMRRLKVIQIETADLYLTVQSYYDEFGPIGHQDDSGQYAFLHKKYISNVRSGEQIAAPADLRQGSISDVQGVPVGIDINSERPIFVDYADNNLPPSTIVSAASGSGKTYLMQTILLGLLNAPDVYFPVIIDFKNEYEDLARSAGMQIISNSPADGLYLDTMEIPEPTGNEEVDERAKENSLTTTENIFEILLGDSWKEMKPAFSFVRRSLYRHQHVLLDDKDTWTNSRGLTFHSFYNEINKVLTEQVGQAKEIADIEVFIKMQQVLSDYFESDGDKASYFKRPIRMKDISGHRGIVFALDRNGEVVGSTSGDIKLLLTMQFIMFVLNNLTDRQNDRRLIPIFWEETNQLLLMSNIASMISGLTSGGRSRGIRNFFITNSPGQIFGAEKESQFSTVDPKLISTIISNAQSIIVGPNSSQDMATIAERYHLDSQTLRSYLSLLAEQATNDNSDSSVMAHKFIIRHRGKAALIQAVSNQALDELNLFGTSLDMNKEKASLADQKKALMDKLYEDSSPRANINLQKESAEIEGKLKKGGK